MRGKHDRISNAIVLFELGRYDLFGIGAEGGNSGNWFHIRHSTPDNADSAAVHGNDIPSQALQPDRQFITMWTLHQSGTTVDYNLFNLIMF